MSALPDMTGTKRWLQEVASSANAVLWAIEHAEDNTDATGARREAIAQGCETALARLLSAVSDFPREWVTK